MEAQYAGPKYETLYEKVAEMQKSVRNFQKNKKKQ